MSKVTLEQARDEIEKMQASAQRAVNAETIGGDLAALQRMFGRLNAKLQVVAEAIDERIAMDEAAVRRSPYVGGRFSSETPFDCPQCSGHGLLESGQACNLCDTTGFIKPPAQPPIDLAGIREVIEGMRKPMPPAKASSSSRYWEGYSDAMNDAADKLSSAIGDMP